MTTTTKFQVLMLLRACVYVEADSQEEANERAATVAKGCEGVAFAVQATGEMHRVLVDEGEVSDVDAV